MHTIFWCDSRVRDPLTKYPWACAEITRGPFLNSLRRPVPHWTWTLLWETWYGLSPLKKTAILSKVLWMPFLLFQMRATFGRLYDNFFVSTQHIHTHKTHTYIYEGARLPAGSSRTVSHISTSKHTNFAWYKHEEKGKQV